MCRQFNSNKIINLHSNDSGLSVKLPFSAIHNFPNLNAFYLVELSMIAASIIHNKIPNTTDKIDVF